MKKLAVCLAVTLSSFLVSANAYVPYGVNKLDVVVPRYCGAFTFGIYGLYWRPAVAHLDYVLVWDSVDDSGDPVFSSGGEPISLNPSYNWGYKANVGYIFPCSGYDIAATYTNYDHDFKEFIPNSAPGLSSFMSLARGEISSNTLGFADPVVLAFPFNDFEATIDASRIPIDFSEARTDFAYQAWDLELGKSVSVGCDIRFRWFGGIRYMQLDHELNVDYIGSLTTSFIDTPAPGASLTVNANADLLVTQDSNYNGVGPRFGMGVNYFLSRFDWSGWCDCPGWFGLTGEVSTSVLIGQIKSSLKENFERSVVGSIAPPPIPSPVLAEMSTVTSSEVSDFRNPHLIRIVPNFEGRLGINYNYQFGRIPRAKLTVEAGWQVTHYWNVIERMTALFDSPEFRIRQTLDATFEGPYLGVQVNI